MADRRFADECHEEVTRQGELQSCDKPAVALRIDPEGDPAHPYPVCAYHCRAPMVALRDLLDAVSRG